MNADEQRALEKLLADVAGVSVYEEGSWYYHGTVYYNNRQEPSDICWKPLSDANQMELIQDALICDGFAIKVEWDRDLAKVVLSQFGEDPLPRFFQANHKDWRMAFALAIKAMHESTDG